jgi:signal transduction histidine kinase
MLFNHRFPSKIRQAGWLNPESPNSIGNLAMARFIDQSFRLLLNLEWLLIATAIVMEVLLPFQPSWLMLGRVLAIGLFGLLGLRLPRENLSKKILYTAMGLGLIWLAVLQEGLPNRSIFLLCLVLVMRSCLLFRRLGQFVVVVLSLLTYAIVLLSRPIIIDKSIIFDGRVSNIMLFSLTLIFALLLINALLSERQSRSQLETVHQELEATHAQLRSYALRIEDQATLQERNRIAREIHDGLGHTLAAQTIQINNTILFWQSDPNQAVTFLKEAKQLGAEAFLEVRKSVSMLRSNPLQGQRLEIALDKLLTDFQHTTGIPVTQDFQLSAALPVELNTTLFRIVQESLTNITKHAQAKAVTVELQETAGMIRLSIVDDGNGFNPAQNTTGFGLQGMRERAVALRGQLTITSQPAKGCTVLALLPLSLGLR